MKKKIILSLALIISLTCFVSGCGQNNKEPIESNITKEIQNKEENKNNSQNRREIDDFLGEIDRMNEKNKEAESKEDIESSGEGEEIIEFIGTSKLNKIGDFVIKTDKNKLKIALYSRETDNYKWKSSFGEGFSLTNCISEAFSFLYRDEYIEKGYSLTPDSRVDLFSFKFDEDKEFNISFKYKNNITDEEEINAEYILNVIVEDERIVSYKFLEKKEYEKEFKEKETLENKNIEDKNIDEINLDEINENENENINETLELITSENSSNVLNVPIIEIIG